CATTAARPRPFCWTGCGWTGRALADSLRQTGWQRALT
ncbi:MAG: hypothetical protein AVDCRST_MAG08-1177, partial [uncultured Acetobacteraceae bacterium]